MVRTIVGLKLRIIVNQLRTEVWRLVISVLGVLWGLSLLPAIFAVVYGLQNQSPEIRATALTVIFAVLIGGWIVLPMLVTGLDDALEPKKFATFGLSARQIAPGLIVAVFLSVPAIVAAVIVVLLSFTWVDSGPLVTGTAVLAHLVGLVTAVLSGRVFAGMVSRLMFRSFGRKVLVVGLFGLATVIATLAAIILRDGAAGALHYEVPLLVTALGYTPIGIPGAIAYQAALGNWLVVGWQFAALVGWAFLLIAAYRQQIAGALRAPQRYSTARRHGDNVFLRSRLLRAPIKSEPIYTRIRHIRWVDARYLNLTISGYIVPFIFAALIYFSPEISLRVGVGLPLFAALVHAWGYHNRIAFDGAAIWLDIVSGNLGAKIIAARFWDALRADLLPLLGLSTIWLGLIGELPLLPAVLSATVTIYLAVLMISLSSAVYFPYRTARPGENPFTAELGVAGASFVAQTVSGLASFAVMPLCAVPVFLALLVDPLWGWIGLLLTLPLAVLAKKWWLPALGRSFNRRAGIIRLKIS